MEASAILSDISDIAEAILPALWTFLSSTFVMSLIGAVAGAAGGAYGAQLIFQQAAKQKEIITEIRDSNAAIALSAGICNSCLALKKQHVKSLKEKYDQEKSRFEDFKEKREKGEIDPAEIFHFDADLETLMPIGVSIDTLQRLLLEQIPLRGRPVVIGYSLPQILLFLNRAIERRNELVELFSQYPQLPIPLYFGVEQKSGRLDARYPSTLEAIYQYTNDCIYFSHLLYQDLHKHVTELASRLDKEKAPSIHTVSFDGAYTAGLMPDEADYAEWNSMFQGTPDQSIEGKKVG